MPARLPLRSWWIGLTREELRATLDREQSRMGHSRFGRILQSEVSE